MFVLLYWINTSFIHKKTIMSSFFYYLPLTNTFRN
jgi:hypothetical protein